MLASASASGCATGGSNSERSASEEEDGGGLHLEVFQIEVWMGEKLRGRL